METWERVVERSLEFTKTDIMTISKVLAEYLARLVLPGKFHFNNDDYLCRNPFCNVARLSLWLVPEFPSKPFCTNVCASLQQQ